MQENFQIRGCFYRLEGTPCRKYLDIQRKGKYLATPDLVVVMMNPGSSKPLNGRYELNRATAAKPDRTQIQIMRVMDNCGFDFCRIFNLTDIQETKSKTLMEILSKPRTKNLPHSIFDPRRRDDFDDLFPQNTMTLLAWGVHDALNDLAQQAIKKVGTKKIVGLTKANNDLAYYHPLPPSFYKQQQWVSKISKQLKNQKQALKAS